jgi:hypothetical protein
MKSVVEVDTRSIDELEDEIAKLCTHIDAATYRLLRAIAEFNRRMDLDLAVDALMTYEEGSSS